MAHLFNFDDTSPNEMPTATTEGLGIAKRLSALATEHACAMRATAKADLPRQCLAELRALYCGENANNGGTAHREDE